MEPGYLLRFDTVTPAVGLSGHSPVDDRSATDGSRKLSEECASLHASSDFAALRRVSEALDEAAAELKSAHAKRVARYIR